MARNLQDLEKLGKAQLKRIEKMPHEYRSALENISVKRARRVAGQILTTGYCTTEWLQSVGYEHAPRAARDLRERGFQLETLYYRASNGRPMAVYVLGEFEQIQTGSKAQGRRAIDAKIKKALLDKHGSICFIWLVEMPPEKLQVDHRIPFEIAGESTDFSNPDGYMLLSASANRQKSWTCEHCENWQLKDAARCKTCFWASPEHHTHIACDPGIAVTTVLKDELVIERYQQAVSKHGLASILKKIEYAVIDTIGSID